jgi:tetratricopeptide (TPR) repeat protein
MALGGLMVMAILSCPQPVSAQNSISEAWKNCQSPDADKRIAGCTVVIDAKGAGSRSRLSDALDARCWAYHVKSKYDLAIADCKASIAIRPTYSYAYNNLGTAYLGTKDYASALAALDKAVELKPTFVFSRLNRARAFAALGRLEEAKRDYQYVLTIEPGNGEAKGELKTISTADIAPSSNPPPPTAPTSMQSGTNTIDNRRIALVIGNAKYQSVSRLPNAQRDAAAIANELRRVGFQQVLLRNDLTRAELDDALRLFSRAATGADWAVIYYAGHGLEMSGVNYLIPIDAKLQSDRDVEFETVPMERTMTAVEGATKLRLVILDACRNNPFLNQMRRTGATRSVGRGLARFEPDPGSLVVYAAKHGETALDGDDGNSPFAAALTKRLGTPGVEVRRLFDLVRDDVLASTNRRQQPFSYGSLPGSEDFYFVAK